MFHVVERFVSDCLCFAIVTMDAVIENVKSSFEVGVRKVLIAAPKRGNLMTQSNKSKTKDSSKIFNTSLCEICQRESSSVPYLVKDVCTFIQEYCLDLEGIFRISGSSIQITKLKKAFEERTLNNDMGLGACSESVGDGHAAANVLKQFLRKLPEPLIPDEVLKISQESKCRSDKVFADKVRLAMASWPEPHRDTLQYLLSFLQPIMSNEKNRMNVTGLAVVFGPNVFRIPSGAEGLEIQSLANYTFERLLLTCDVICDMKDDQGYLNMTQSPPSPNPKPARVAPPIPMQARPLPPPPVPEHAPVRKITMPNITTSPSVPLRSKSLSHRLAAGDSLDSNIFTSGSYSEPSDSEGMLLSEDNQLLPLHNNDEIEEAISHVVRKHLFTADSSSSCQEDDPASTSNDVSTTSLLPSLTQNRNKGPRRRKPSREHRRSSEDFPDKTDAVINQDEASPTPMPRKKHLVLETHTEKNLVKPTPVQITIALPEEESVFVPKTIFFNDDDSEINDVEFVSFDEAMEVVPPLDLSGVMSADEVRPKPLPGREKDSPSRIKRRKRKKSKSSPIQIKTPPTPLSDPITIPTPKSMDSLYVPGEPQASSPPDGSRKWRDAWSTDEEAIPTKAAMETAHQRAAKYSSEAGINIELAPSSPENHVTEMHSSKRRLQKRHHHHHHHSNRMPGGSPDNRSPSRREDDHSHLVISADKIQTALRANRQEQGRPEDLTLMTREQIRAEKFAMQKELLKHEEKYGRPIKKMEKDIMRGVYERYRTVKRLLADSLAPPFNAPFSQTIDDVRKDDYELARAEAVDEFAVSQTLPISNYANEIEGAGSDSGVEASVSISGNLSVLELRKQQKEAKGERKRLRRKLKEFEKEIEQQYDRKITQADKVVMATEYQELKALKAKIRLLDALINKQNVGL